MLLDALYLLATLDTAHPHYLPSPPQAEIILVNQLFPRRGFGQAGISEIPDEVTPPPSENPSADAGAVLPITYTLASECSGTCTARFIDDTGSGGTCSEASPCTQITTANNLSDDTDDWVVMRAGTYSALGSLWDGSNYSLQQFVTKNNLTLAAYPGETVTIDGAASITAGPWTTETVYKYATYIDRPCTNGSGLSSLCSGQNLQGGDNTAGEYPDQMWIDGAEVQQVTTKAALSTCTPNCFFVDAPNDRAYLLGSVKDTATTIEVCGRGDVLQWSGSGGKLKGITFKRICNTALRGGILNVQPTADNFTMEDVAFIDASMATFFVSGLLSDLNEGFTATRVTIDSPNWMGVLATYAKDATFTHFLCTGADRWNEYASSPVGGCIKTSKGRNFVINKSYIANNRSQGLWFDQSNYLVVVANSTIENSGLDGEDTCVFFEISDYVFLINTLIKCPIRNALKVAGSSGVYVVNATILGGPDVLGIYADTRSLPTCAVDGVRRMTGTVAYSAGTTVTGTGSLFIAEIKAGETITINGQTRTVLTTPVSNTSLTVSSAFSGSASGQAAVVQVAIVDCGGFASDRWQAASPTLPATMTWITGIDLIQDSIIGYPTGAGFCQPSLGVPVAVCWADTHGYGVPSIPWNKLIHVADVPNGRPQTVIDCNIYALDGSQSPVGVGDPTTTGSIQYLSLAAWSTAMAGAAPYPDIDGIDANSQVLGLANVSAAGVLSGISHSTACGVPVHAIINTYLDEYLTAGQKHLGVTWE